MTSPSVPTTQGERDEVIAEWERRYAGLVAGVSELVDEIAALKDRCAEEEHAYQAANERAERLWLELYGEDGITKSLARQAADWRRRGEKHGGVIFLGDAADVLDSLIAEGSS